MPTASYRLPASLLAIAIGLCAATAWADPSEADKENAHRLMAEGRERRAAKDFKTALQSFEAADSIMHVPTTGFEVARTEVALGLLVEAQEKLAAVAHLPKVGRESKGFAEARSAAAALAEDIAPRIPSLKIIVRGVPEGGQAKVAVDGVNVPIEALTGPRPVNPGHHVIVARVVGGARRETSVDVPAGTIQEVVVALPEALAARPATPVPTQAPPPEPPPAHSHALTIVGFTFAGAGLATGAVTGLLAMSKLRAAKANGCVDNECPPAAYPDLSASSTMATVSTIGFIAAGAGAALGVVGLVVAGRGGSEETTPPSPTTTGAARRGPFVAPWVSLGAAGVSGSF